MGTFKLLLEEVIAIINIKRHLAISSKFGGEYALRPNVPQISRDTYKNIYMYTKVFLQHSLK